MALSTIGDVIGLALRAAGVFGVGQTANPQDTQDALDLANTLLSEWQITRWLTQTLVNVTFASTGAVSYTVGPGGNFVTSAPRPDKVDAAIAKLTSSGAETILYPYMSREGYDRVVNKAATGTPERFFYDPGVGTTGTVFFTPVPSNLYSLILSVKVSLGQFTATTDTITLPKPYIVALLWNLAADLRPVFGKPEDPQVTRRAERSLLAMVNSIAQLPNAVEPMPSNRAGIFSTLAPAPRQQK